MYSEFRTPLFCHLCARRRLSFGHACNHNFPTMRATYSLTPHSHGGTPNWSSSVEFAHVLACLTTPHSPHHQPSSTPPVANRLDLVSFPSFWSWCPDVSLFECLATDMLVSQCRFPADGTCRPGPHRVGWSPDWPVARRRIGFPERLRTSAPENRSRLPNWTPAGPARSWRCLLLIQITAVKSDTSGLIQIPALRLIGRCGCLPLPCRAIGLQHTCSPRTLTKLHSSACVCRRGCRWFHETHFRICLSVCESFSSSWMYLSVADLGFAGRMPRTRKPRTKDHKESLFCSQISLDPGAS
ncbi:hypothetical protein C8R43DRAFT_490831 [Mycena crocata]|nr:hypothetical protein C8R43DRAFT_490831 [Mycena crocata]